MKDYPSELSDIGSLVSGATKAFEIVADRSWIESGVGANGGLQALSEPLRPIDALDTAGLSWLTSYVRPYQDVIDRLTGNSAVIQSFADTWQKVSSQVSRIQEQLARSAPADTAGWQGAAADRYRKSAADLGTAVGSTATLSATVATVAHQMGEAAASARRTIAELVTDLVQRLIRTVGSAMAAAGGVTSYVLAEASKLIALYTTPIEGVLRQLQTTTTNAAANVGTTDIAFGATKTWFEDFVKPRGPVPPEQTRGLIMAQFTTAMPARLSPEKLRQLTDDYVFNTELRRFIQYRSQARYGEQLDWSSDGCTSALNQPAGWNFLPACQRHDFGYRNFKLQGRFDESTRKKIDRQFYADMTGICSAMTGDANYTECQLSRDIYYRAVRQAGGN